MTGLLDELKVRARLALNAARRAEADSDAVRLRHCLNQAARDVGFAHWDHARAVLGGLASRDDDMGTFWHAPRTGILLNLWLAKYAQAQAFLLPYRRQFMVVQADFIQELGVDAAHPAWADTAHDLVAAYGGDAWLQLAGQRLKAPRSSFVSDQAPVRQNRP